MSQCLRGKNWENLRKSWKSVRSTQNIVMNEEFVKHSVVKAKTDPKVCGGIHFRNWLAEGTIYSPATRIYRKNKWMEESRGC